MVTEDEIERIARVLCRTACGGNFHPCDSADGRVCKPEVCPYWENQREPATAVLLAQKGLCPYDHHPAAPAYHDACSVCGHTHDLCGDTPTRPSACVVHAQRARHKAYLRAQIGSLTSMLNAPGREDDPVGTRQFTARIAELKAELESLPD